MGGFRFLEPLEPNLGAEASHFMGTKTSSSPAVAPRRSGFHLAAASAKAGLARRSLLAEAANRGGYGKLEIAVTS